MKNSYSILKSRANRMLSALLLSITLLIGYTANAALSGSYTIDASKSASSTNYTSFNDAVNDLLNGSRSSGTANGPGVSGAVTFSVATGSYFEQVELTAVSGTSSTNTITFKSSTGKKDDVILKDTSGSSTANYLIHLDGAKNITFKDMTLSRYAEVNHQSYSVVINIENSADSNFFINNNILGDLTANTYPTLTQTVIYSNGTNNVNYALFDKNVIRHGSYSIYWWRSIYSASSTYDSFNTFTNNVIDSNFGYFTYFNGQGNFKFDHNNLSKSTYQYTIAMYLYFASGNVSIQNNNIDNNNGYYGILAYYLNSDSLNPSRICNNMISVHGGTYNYYGVYIYQSTYAYITSNTIYLNGTYSYGGALNVSGYTSGSVNYVNNNNLINDGVGFTYYTSGTVVTDEDYNNHYAPSISKPIYYSGTLYDLASYQSATSLGTNDIQVDPKLASIPDNLHASSIKLFKKGKDLSVAPYNITKDIDGDVRATLPCIGADEFTPVNNDLAAVSIDSPSAGFCSGSQNIYVKVTNTGLNTITSATINWTLGGVAQTAATFSGSLASGNDTIIKLGSSSFSSTGTVIQAIVKTVNSSTPDGNQNNDTATRKVYTGLSGAYTVGGSTADFNTVQDAVDALTKRGLCSSVVFNILDGTYSDQVSIPAIPGTSATKTVTFQSKSLDSTKVVFNAAPGGSPNYVFQLNGASWVTFNKISIIRTGTAAAIGFDLTKGASNNTIKNCFVQVPTNYYPASTINSQNTTDSGNLVLNNELRGGYYNMYITGNYGSPKSNWTIVHNTIDSFYYMGILAQYHKNLVIHDNQIKDNSYTYGGYGIYEYYAEGASKITKNYISMINGGYGIYTFYFGGNGATGTVYSDTGMVANNQIYIANNTSYTYAGGVGIYSYYPNGAKYVFNTILDESNSSYNNYCFATYNYSSTYYYEVQNNVFQHTGSGYSVYLGSLTGLTTIDHNDYYAAGTNLYSISGSTGSSLSGLQSATSQDANSLNIDPKIPGSPADLRTKANGLIAKGVSVYGITTDYYDSSRASKPTIGANEIKPLQLNAGISKVDSPSLAFCPGTKDVYATLTNSGIKPLKTATIRWWVNGSLQGTLSYSNSTGLATYADTMIKLGSYAFSKGSSYTVKVAIDSTINGAPDQDRSDDTAYRSVTPSLSGTYTVGTASGRDFSSVIDAMDAVTNGGVCGPVVFNIDNDTYSGAHRLGKINGASAVNTITFQGTTSDSSLVVLTDVAPTGYSYPGNGALELDGASYVTFKKLTVSMTGTSTSYYAHGVLFKGGSHHNNFISCAMRTAALYGGALWSNTDNDSNNTFDKVYFWGGYYGVYFGNGSYSSTNQENNNVWTKCWTDSNTYYGFYLNGEGNYTITQSKMINLTNKYAGGYGIFGYYNSGVTITRNYIHNTTGGGYGIYGYYMVGSKVDSSYIMNNMISIENPNSVTGYGNAGMYLYYSDYLNVYNNSVNSKAGSSNEYGMYFYNYSTASQFNIVNNCLVTGAGVPLAISSTSAISYSDHNNLFDFGAGNVGSISGSISTSLTSWRSATSGWDTNSVAINPSYRNDSDLHAKSAGINGKAAVRTDVKIDIDGDVRSSSTPDIGADEFTPIGDDASANRIVSPSASACGDSNVKIIAEVGNVGLNTITSMPVKYYVYNALTGAVVDSGVQTYSRSLASGSNDTFTLKYAWNTYTGGSFKIKVVTNLAKDGDHTNDSTVSYVTYYPHFGNPTALGASSCGGSSTLSLIATPAKTGDKLFWYDATGALVNKGDTFKTSVTKTTTFYVQAKGDTSNEGADYSTMGGSFSNYSYTNAYLEFDAKRNIVIDSVDVYASTSGTVTVTIKDASGTTLGSTTSTVSGTGSAERIPVKVTVPMGTAYRMYRGGSATLAYNYNFTSPYVPYPFSGKNVDVTASYLGTFSYKYYYWYFYNWVVTDTNACASKLIPVVATVGTGGKPTASFTKSHLCANDSAMFTDNSTIASGSISGGTIAFGDGSTGAIKTAGGSVYHKYAKAGTYKVTFSAVGSGGCTDDTTIAVVISRAPSAGFSTSKVCEGDSASFVDTTTITGSVKRTWYFDGVKSTSTSQITKNAFATGGGAHTASIVITSAGCTDSVTRTIAVNPTPIAKFMVDSATLCKSGAIGFIADTTKSTGSTYSWNFGDASAAGSGQSTTHTYASNGTYTASLTATSAAGCVSKNLASMSVIVTPAPTAAFKFNVKAGYAVDFMATDTTGTTNTYAWDFGDLNSGSGKTVSHTYASKAVYVAKLSISNVNKCATSDTHSVNLTPIIEQSNAPFGLGVAPNPFRDNTVITYTLSSTEKVTITVTDLLGRVMANVTSAVQNAGQYRVELSATDNNMSAGMYLIRFVAGNKVVVKQIEAVR